MRENGLQYQMFDKFNDILSVDDLCQALNIGRNTAYKLLNNGTIKSIRIGKVHKIPKVSLIGYALNTGS